MKREQIMNLIKSLAASQGLFGRLLNAIQELDEGAREALFEALENMNFTSDIDFILYVEG